MASEADAELAQQHWFAEALGYDCVDRNGDTGTTIGEELEVRVGKGYLVNRPDDQWNEDDLCDFIEVYHDLSARPTMISPYDIPNFTLEGFDVVVNKSKVAAYRAPGAPMASFAVEGLLDEIAQKIGMDPIELRLKNAAVEGTQAAYGPGSPDMGGSRASMGLMAAEETMEWNLDLLCSLLMTGATSRPRPGRPRGALASGAATILGPGGPALGFNQQAKRC